MKQFFKDIVKQLTGGNFGGEKVMISWRANNQMKDTGIDTATVEDIFKNGRKVTSVVQDYRYYTISVSYRWDEKYQSYVITSVRLYKRGR